MRKKRSLKKGLRSAHWCRNKALPYAYNQFKDTAFEIYADIYYKMRGIDSSKFVNMMDEDWDNLLILDACRYDVFKQESSLPGKLSPRYSLGSQTPLFLEKNFCDGTFHDTVYVSANPHQKKQLDDRQFHEVYHVWESHWDDELKSVHPSDVADVAKSANREHGDKRLIVHLMQPHEPFIGEYGRREIGIRGGYQHARDTALEVDDVEELAIGPYQRLERGELSREAVERAYRENLNIALETVSNLLPALNGKTVISADHGELFGEYAWPFPWREYSHPPIKAEKLLQVPWNVVTDGTRKSIKAEKPVQDTVVEENDELENKLKDLGYR